MIQLIINTIYSSVLIFFIAYSFQVIYKTARFFHIAHAATITLSAYFVFLFKVEFNIGFFESITAAILLTTLINILIAQYIYKPLQIKKSSSWAILIASLGVYIILHSTISLYFGASTKSFRLWNIEEGYRIIGGYITFMQIVTIATVFFLTTLTLLYIENSRIGKYIKAVSSNPSLSLLFGISKYKTILSSFIIGSFLASIAGILIAFDSDMTPTMGFNYLLYAVIAMIIGGMGKVIYLLVGSLLIAFTQQFSAYFIDSKWMNAIAFLILILFLIWKPFGFSGEQIKKVEV